MKPGLALRVLSAPGRGAITVLELDGAEAELSVRGLTGGWIPALGEFAPRVLRDREGAVVDEALVLTRAAGRFELHLHGGSAVLERVAAALGLTPVRAGGCSIEDLAAIELAQALSESAARMLLDQAEGALRRELVELLLLEDEPFRSRAQELAARGRSARWLLRPPRVVLAGPANAGKSTLFNALAGLERAVVDTDPGTTRDVLVERVRLGGYAVELFDTAGEREVPAGAQAAIEQQGQRLAADARARADLVLWLVPPGGVPPAPRAGERWVLSRADEWDRRRPVGPAIAARGEPEAARAIVGELVLSALGLPPDPWRPRAGVPFLEAWQAALENDAPRVLRGRIAEWLVPDPHVDPPTRFE